MSTGETWTLGHRPALDGLRGMAVLAVVAHHTYLLPVFGFGGVGVTMFFTLSGFLITALLVQERQDHGRIDLWQFYARRARRLFPALAAFVIVSVLAWRAPLSDVGYVASYVGNWAIIAGHHLGGFHHTWSLAVEEQFYLAWPLVVIALARRPHLLWWLTVAAIAVSVVARFALWDGGAGYARVYYGSDTRADALLVGCLLALALRQGRTRTGVVGRLGLCTAIVGICAFPLLSGNLPPMYALVLPTVVPPLMALAILSALGSSPRWLTWRPLTLIGRRSYALYLWHYQCLALGREFPVPEPVQILAGLALAWTVTSLSWRYVEDPFLRYRTAQHAVCHAERANVPYPVTR